MSIPIKISKNSDTKVRLGELFKNLSVLNNCPTWDDLELDFSQLQWVTPLSILPLAVKISEYPNFRIANYPNEGVRGYLQTICFPSGTQISALRDGTYLPILKTRAVGVDTIIDHYRRAVLGRFFAGYQYQGNLSNIVGYFLGEMATNVIEHSQANEFWIMSQYWNQNNECEICFVDNGVGLAKAYNIASIPVKDDEESIRKAIQGISSKNNYERGYGISSNNRLFTESPLQGEFVLVTGDAGYFRAHGQSPILFRINNFSWQGTVIMVKFKRPGQEINFYEYIE